MSVSEQLKTAIANDPRTMYALARDAKVSPIQIWRFTQNERGLTTKVVDRLCEALGLELRPRRRRAKDR